MSILIEQSVDEAKACLRLVNQTEMDHICLTESRAKCLNSVDGALKSKLSVTLRFKALTHKLDGPKFRVRTGFEFKIVSDEEDPKDFVKIYCAFEAHYRVAENYQPTMDELNAFRKANAVFNSWPFFREYIQSTVSRMGFPPPPVPFLRLQPRKDMILRGSKKTKSLTTTTGADGASERGRKA